MDARQCRLYPAATSPNIVKVHCLTNDEIAVGIETPNEFVVESAIRFLRVKVDPLIPVMPIPFEDVDPAKVNEFSPLAPLARVSELAPKLTALVVEIARLLVPVPSIVQT